MRLRPPDCRRFTLEELCRYYWRIDRPGFTAFTNTAPGFRVFLDIFEREDAEADRREAASLGRSSFQRRQRRQ